MNITLRLHDDCMAAVQSCPQCRLDHDTREQLSNGTTIELAELPGKGLASVVRYWASPDTIGGALLWNGGYAAELSVDSQRIFERYDQIIQEAAERLASEFN